MVKLQLGNWEHFCFCFFIPSFHLSLHLLCAEFFFFLPPVLCSPFPLPDLQHVLAHFLNSLRKKNKMCSLTLKDCHEMKYSTEEVPSSRSLHIVVAVRLWRVDGKQTEKESKCSVGPLELHPSCVWFEEQKNVEGSNMSEAERALSRNPHMMKNHSVRRRC